ncbi:MAG: hypothetical protein SGARI_008009, partial [Bacillariaceae sp.]
HHLPPHCINVFYPLIDLEQELGPTEVQAGSHRLGKFYDPTQSRFGLEANAGDAILFDYRLKHRGGVNLSFQQDRPILYLAYAKPWFMDTANTRSRSSIFADHNDAAGLQQQKSRPWVSRLLTGQAMPMGTGFENHSAAQLKESTASLSQEQTDTGSGERWVLFKMNVQLGDETDDDDDVAAAATRCVTFYNGDVPVEVATQFVLQHGLSHDFVPVLTETIQEQMIQAKATMQ